MIKMVSSQQYTALTKYENELKKKKSMLTISQSAGAITSRLERSIQELQNKIQFKRIELGII